MPFFLHSSPRCLPSLLPQSLTPSNSRSAIFFTAKGTNQHSSSRLLLHALPNIDQELLQILTKSDGATGKPTTHLPAIRSYETDLARLTLIGSVSFDQALIAAAADGGSTADEHLAAGASTMVVETVFRSGADEHSTLSTRLFLPTEMVKEKARKLRSSLAANILYSKEACSKNILAMTFRQVVLQRLWSLQLSLYCPGTERNMDDLDNIREAWAGFIVNSSDEKFISSLAEVVSYCAVESTKNNYIQESHGLHLERIFHWFQKPQEITSNDSSISICRISESEVAKKARSQVEAYNLVKGKYVNRLKKMNYSWWFPPDYSRFDFIGGPGFGSWICEFVPTYRLQINTSTFKDVKLEGCHKLADNRWEVLLTHNQMVELAYALDMYYEDHYTMPNKKMLCDVITETSVALKRKNMLWKFLFVLFAGGCVVMIFGILAQLAWTKHARKLPELKNIPSVSQAHFSDAYSFENTETETLCTAIIKNIKDELGWSGDVSVDMNIGVWIGTLPSYLRNKNLLADAISESPTTFCAADSESHNELSTCACNALSASDPELQKIASDVASYQAVLTKDGKIVGFQPTSRAAVNHWSSNPLAKSLYGAKKLSPGLLEPRLNIQRPPDAIPIELLMSTNPESVFALARPMRQ